MLDCACVETSEVVGAYVKATEVVGSYEKAVETTKVVTVCSMTVVVFCLGMAPARAGPASKAARGMLRSIFKMPKYGFGKFS